MALNVGGTRALWGDLGLYKKKKELSTSVHLSLLHDCIRNGTSWLQILQPKVSLTTTKDQNSFWASVSYPPW